MSVRVRFAPSPTGHLHVGGARTALFNFYFARHHGGKFILRIEDTDRQRSTREFEEGIFKGMQWLGMSWDEEPIRQSERQEVYLQYAQKLLDEGKAYKCFCTAEEVQKMREEAMARKEKPRYNRKCRDLKPEDHPKDQAYSIRFKAPLDGEVVVNDLILGEIKVSNEEGDDFILVRSDGTPTYQLSVVVDDMEMGITHIIRGDDHMSNTPKQILLWQAFAKELPQFAHVPMILGPDKAKLSKRHGAVAVFQYRDQGYLPEAFRNGLIRLGWSHGDQELFTHEELIQFFDLDACGKSPSVFDQQKLRWINHQFIMKMNNEEFLKKVQELTEKDFSFLSKSEKLLNVLKDKTEVIHDFPQHAEFVADETFQIDEDCQKKVLDKTDPELITAFIRKIEALESIQAEEFFPLLKSFAEEKGVGVGNIAKPVRVLLTGTLQSPDLGLVAEAFGKEKVLQRLRRQTP